MDTKELYDYILKIQSIAKIGLVFSKDPYAITNYQQINDLTLEMLEKLMEMVRLMLLHWRMRSSC